MPRRPTTIRINAFGSFNPNNVSSRSLALPSTLSRGPTQPLQHFSDRRANATQQGSLRAMATAVGNPFIDGQYIPAINFVANTPLAVQHSLGRAFVDAWIMVPFGFARIGQIPNSPKSLDVIQITLQADVTITAGVYVF
ncbi:MAG TPA: hypothetical protein VF219_19510 [Vicinamibacterales bacterium]